MTMSHRRLKHLMRKGLIPKEGTEEWNVLIELMKEE